MSVEVEDKAVALVGTGKVRISVYTVDVISGEVDGENGTYTATIDPEGSWCTCVHGSHRNPHAECSHILAIRIESVRLDE